MVVLQTIVILLSIQGAWSRNRYPGTWYQQRGSSTMSGTYLPVPFTVDELSSASVLPDRPTFVFVPGQEMDTGTLRPDRYKCATSTMTFPIIPSYVPDPTWAALHVHVEQTDYNSTECYVYESQTFGGPPNAINVTNNASDPNNITINVPPGVAYPDMVCFDPINCVSMIAQCSDLIDLLTGDYIDPDFPLVLTATERNEIKTILPSSSYCGTPTYRWRMIGVANDQLTFVTVSMKPFQTDGGIFLIRENVLDPGMYILFLEASTSYPFSTYTEEYIFIKMVLPELRPIITGPAIRTMLDNTNAYIDARTSTDPAMLIPSVRQSGVDANWFIFASISLTPTDVYNCLATFPNCSLLTTNTSDIKGHSITYTGSTLRIDPSVLSCTWALVIFRLTDGSRTSSALAALNFQSSAFLQYTYSCVHNCYSANVIKGPSGIAGFEVNVNVNTQVYSVTYTRALLQWDGTTFITSGITLQQGILSESLSETDAPLVAGELYLLTLDVNIDPLSTLSNPSMNLSIAVLKRINFLPYGGNCSIDKTSGSAGSTVYTVTCYYWSDEGERYTRDMFLDQNPTVSYAVVQRNGDGEDYILAVSDGPKMSFVAIAGNDTLGYSATIAVKVLDMYNEAAEEEFFISSSPVLNSAAITADDTGAAEIRQYTSAINSTFYNLTDIDMSISVGMAAAKELNIVQIPVSELEVTRTIDGQPGVLIDININDDDAPNNHSFNNYFSTLLNTTLDPATVAIREGVQLITDRINSVMVQRVNSGQKYYDQGYLDQLTQCFTELISVKAYVTDNTKLIAEQALATLAAASGNIWLSHATSEDQQVQSKTQLVDMSGNILSVVVPDNLNQARLVYDLSSALGQIDDMIVISGSNMSKAVDEAVISPTERAYLYLKSQNQLQEDLSLSQTLARDTSKSIEEMTDDILQTTGLCTGCSQMLGSGSMVQNVSVLPTDSLNNVTLSAKTSSIQVNLGAPASADKLAVAMSHFDKNIFMYDSDLVSSLVAYGVMHAVVGNNRGVVTSEVTYQQTVDEVERELVYPYIVEDDVSKFSLHKFIYRSPIDEVCLNLEPLDNTTTSRYDVYIRFTEAPTIRDYDVLFAVSSATDWVKCIESSAMNGHIGITYVGIKIVQAPGQSRRRRDVRYAAHASTTTMDLTKQSISGSDVSSAYTRHVLRRRKRQTNTTVTAQTTYPPYYFAAVTASCMNWDETKTAWNSDVCKMTWEPSLKKVTCQCNNVPQMTFGTSFFVAPATIDFSTAFLRFSLKSQAAIIGAIVVVFIIYGILLVWARREDQRDMQKWGILPLADNYEEDTSLYLISVHTGLRLGAATESRVGFVLGGHRTDTGVREMYDGVRKQFSAGSILQFMMTTQFHLGQLTHMRIWHDNSGKGNMASWYLSRVTVYDMRKRETYMFLCERWISVENCSGDSLECILSATNPNTEAFDYTFMNHAKRTIADDHTWVSFVYRPTFSNFTRTQRVTCAILFIFVNMVVNAMYYNPAEEYETDTLLEVGPCRLGMKQLSVSIITALITTPSTFLIVIIFKLSRRATLTVKDTTSQSKYETESQNGVPEDKKVSCCARFCSGKKPGTEPVMYIEEQNRSCMLPGRFAYVGWFLAVGGIVTSAFFVLLYSIEWGEQKSGEWLATFILSLLQSVLLVDPIKVAFFAFCLALVKKTLETSNFNKIDTDTAKSLSKNAEQTDELPRQQLTPSELKVAKETRKVEAQWNRIILDLVFNLLSVWLLLSISYSNTNIHSYRIHDAILNSMSLNSTGDNEFGEISSTWQLYKWLNYTAIPKLFPEEYINGETLHWSMREYMDGLTLYRLGPPRLRQFRIEKESCHLPKVDTQDCYRGYSLSSEETDDFCIGWGIPPCSDSWLNYSTSSWKYTDLDAIENIPLFGNIATYSGDGYFMAMDINGNLSKTYVQELYDYVWIDKSTRAVILEFTVFCPNVNLFAYGMFLVEFPASGGAFSSFSIYPVRVYNSDGALGAYIFFCEIMGLLFLVVLAAQLVYGCFIYKCRAFKKFWFLLDFLRLCVLVTTVALYLIRRRVLSTAISQFQADRRAFVDFYSVTFWNQLVIYMLGVSVFMACIRILKILEGNKNIYIISTVFARLASDLFWFSILFLFFITAFAMLGYLLFGSRLYAYMSMYSSLRTLFVTIMGKNRFTEMNESDPILAKVYFFCFVCIITMVMFSIILSSLNQCILKVRQEFSELTYKQDAFQYGFNKIATKILRKDSENPDRNRVFPLRDVNRREETMSL